MEHICFEVQLCIKISKFKEISNIDILIILCLLTGLGGLCMSAESVPSCTCRLHTPRWHLVSYAAATYPGCAFAAILIFLAFFRKIRNFIFSHFFDFLDMFLIFWKNTKMRAPKFHAKPTDECPEISHMRPIQARKLKLKIDPFSRPHKKI